MLRVQEIITIGGKGMNVIFDIGKVLIDFDFEDFVREMYGEETGQILIDAMWKNPDWARLDEGVLSDEEVLKLFIAKAPAYEKEIRTVFAKLGSCPRLRPTTIPMIDRLHAEGHRVYYLSNYFEYLIHAAPWALDFISHTDGGVFSCFEHVLKPDPRIYGIICERYGLRPAECVFIDDTLINVRGAEAVGIKAIHYTGQTAEELIKSIDDIQ